MEYRKLSDLKKLEGNPRTISKDDMARLVASIKKFGILEARPLILSDRTGELVVIGGNQRYEAAKTLGLKEAPTELIPNLSEEDEREIIIRDNVANGEWDMEMLANEWDAEKLQDWGVEINFETVEPTVDDDDFKVDEGVKTDIVLGDLFEIGEHRLLCGDSTNIDDVNKLMNGEKADFGFCDPPYNLGFEYNSYDDNKTDEEYEQFSKDWFSNLSMYTDRQAITLGTKNIKIMANLGEPTGVGCWVKKNWITSCRIAKLQQWEPIFFFGDYTKYKRTTDLFEINREYQEDVGKNHTCPKQIKLIADILQNYSSKSVLDLFGGSGTTMVACHQLNRKGYGMELDCKYCDVIIRRMLNLDNGLIIKRNGVDETLKWIEKIG